jgi:hypothetical protein
LKRGSSVNGIFADRQEFDAAKPIAVKQFTVSLVYVRILLGAREEILTYENACN